MDAAIVAALAWPTVGLLLGLIALGLFRRELSLLIGRTRKVGKDLVAFHGQSAQVQDEPKAVEEFFNSFASPAVLETEKNLLQDKIIREAAPGPDREKVYLRALAAALVTMQWERCAGIIWGSQVAALNYLNVKGTSDMTDLVQFYDKGKTEFPERYGNYPFQNWLAFLENFALIGRKESHVWITVNGREFLKHFVGVGRALPEWG